MARGATSGMQAEVAKRVLEPVLLFEGEFVSGTIRLWSGGGQLPWNSLTWDGVGGKLLGVSSVTEVGGMRAEGIAITLSGIPNDIVTKALAEVQHSKKGTIWFGCRNSSGGVVVDPTKIFVGRADVATVKKGPKESIITITYELQLIDRRANVRRFTHEDQALDYGKRIAISSISRTGNVVTLDTSVPHDIGVTGQKVIVEGVADSSFNGNNFTVSTIPNSTRITYAQTAANASSSGGTVRCPDLGFEYVNELQDKSFGASAGGVAPAGGVTAGTGGGGMSSNGGMMVTE